MKKTTLLKMLLLVAVVSINVNSYAQTTLSPGDLMLVNVNADGNDNFDFVPLVDLGVNTVINFTDNAWTGSTLKSNEGILTYTASSTVLKGTIVSFSGSIGGEWTSSGSFNTSGSGDEILVYQGTSSSPSFIYGIGWATTSPWITTGTTTSNNSFIPSELSESANTIVSLGTYDNNQYDIQKGTSGTKSELLALIANSSNWSGDNSNVYSALTTNFSVTSGPISGLSESKNLNLFASDGKVIFETEKTEKVVIFNSVGQQVVNTFSVEGRNEISVPNAKGMYIVKVGTQTAKVIL